MAAAAGTEAEPEAEAAIGAGADAARVLAAAAVGGGAVAALVVARVLTFLDLGARIGRAGAGAGTGAGTGAAAAATVGTAAAAADAGCAGVVTCSPRSSSTLTVGLRTRWLRRGPSASPVTPAGALADPMAGAMAGATAGVALRALLARLGFGCASLASSSSSSASLFAIDAAARLIFGSPPARPAMNGARFRGSLSSADTPFSAKSRRISASLRMSGATGAPS